MEDLMKKINTLILSSLVVVAPAFGMNNQNQANQNQGGIWAAVKRSLGTARNNVRQNLNDAPGLGIANQVTQARKDMNDAKQEVKDTAKEIKGMVNDGFGFIESGASALFGFQEYSAHITTLDHIEEALDLGGMEIIINKNEFKNIVDAEKEALKKQNAPRQVGARQVNRFNAKQPVMQNKVGEITNLVTQLENNIENYNRALDVQQRAANIQQGGRGRMINGNPTAQLDNARKTLQNTIEALRTKIEKQRDAAAKKSPAGEFVYGGTGLRSWLTMGALALGALYFGQAMKEEPVVQEYTSWISDIFSTVVTGVFSRIAGLFA
jgi:hypothetical protein